MWEFFLSPPLRAYYILVSLHDAKYSKAYYPRRWVAILSLLSFALYGCCVMLSKVIPNKCVVFLKHSYTSRFTAGVYGDRKEWILT